MSPLIIILISLTVISTIITININNSKLKILQLLILLTFIIKISEHHFLAFKQFEMNHFSIFSTIIILSFSLIFFKKIEPIIYCSFISILCLVSINFVLIFYLVYEIYIFSFFILDKKYLLTKKFVVFNYVLSLFISTCVMLFYLLESNYFLLILILLYLARFVVISIHLNCSKIKSLYLIFYLIIFQIILVNFINIHLKFISSESINMFFLITISLFIIFNTFKIITNLYYDSYYVINIFLLFSIILSIFTNDANLILISFVLTFLLLFLLSFPKLHFIYNFLLAPTPLSPFFYYELQAIKSLELMPYLLFFVLLMLMFYKIKNIEYFGKIISTSIKR